MNSKLISALLLTLFVLIPFTFFAQNNNEGKTLLGDGANISTQDLGFFIAPTFGMTQMDGSLTSLFNLRGGISYKDKISLGAFTMTSLNEVIPKSESIPNIYMDYWSVGGFVEYTLMSKRLFHLTFPVYLGYGEVEMDDYNGEPGLGESNFFKIEPSAYLEINLHKYVRINVGAGYRIISQMEYRNFNQSDISGLTGYVGLKFGLFN